MKTTLLIDFIETAIAHNKKHFFFDVIVPNFDRLVIQGYEYKGYVGCITSLEAYYNVNMDMLKPDVYKELFLGNRRIYTGNLPMEHQQNTDQMRKSATA